MPMKEKTAELVIKIVLVIVDWANAILKDKRKEKTNDSKGTAKKRSQG
jgi:hypothetical protein